MAIGAAPGQNGRGDNRTPTGNFAVQQVQDSTSWVYDFGDGKGPTRGLRTMVHPPEDAGMVRNRHSRHSCPGLHREHGLIRMHPDEEWRSFRTESEGIHGHESRH